mgnify:CR=1 FL=1
MTNRITFPLTEETSLLFSDDFVEYLLHMHDTFSGQVETLRLARQATLVRAHREGICVLRTSPADKNINDWSIGPLPEELRRPGIEISGPASITRMFINAINPSQNGIRAVGYLDDDEDSGGHSLQSTLDSTLNRLNAVEGNLTYRDELRNRDYAVVDGKLPFFMHRERGLHLDEPEVLIDKRPICAAILGTALTLYYAGQAQIRNNQGVYFYLPKLESASESKFYRDFFDATRQHLHIPDHGIIKAIILIESLPAVFQMDEMLYSLGEYAAGLNAARWDLKASIIEYIMPDPNMVWPDRFEVDIKTTEFLSAIFRRLIAICQQRDAVAIGGMATALPSPDEEINKIAATSIREDKEWEAEQGFIRGWAAHIYHMETASAPFQKKDIAQATSHEGFTNYVDPIRIDVPVGIVSLEGTRRNIRTLIEYLEGWMNGRGAKSIDNMQGEKGKRPALMEDLATARISVGQIAQRIIHAAVCEETGKTHTFSLIKLLGEKELESILRYQEMLHENHDQSRAKLDRERYDTSLKIAFQWIKNYTRYDFRSLASYSREELQSIGQDNPAF